mmetsp:Transcript_7879/g.11431  ORF Transcript_7879/g.11431 Transcript_7879/m.11431 type:complete len:231 (+) Transcript_7879:252-944(+)
MLVPVPNRGASTLFKLISMTALRFIVIAATVVVTILFFVSYDNKRSNNNNITSSKSLSLPSFTTALPSVRSNKIRRTQQNNDILQGYNCIGERMNHDQKMYANTFLCASSSPSSGYIFGMNSNGDLLWSNLETGETKVFYKNTASSNPNTMYFLLTVHGKFRIYDATNGTILWGKKPKSIYRNTIANHTCLSMYPCPYLHQHAGGVCVINWWDVQANVWMQKNINRVYEF